MASIIVTICPNCERGLQYKNSQQSKTCPSCGERTTTNKLRTIERTDNHEQARVYIGEINADKMRTTDPEIGFSKSTDLVDESNGESIEYKLNGNGMSIQDRLEFLLERETPAPREKIVDKMGDYGLSEERCEKFIDKKMDRGIVIKRTDEIDII